MTEWPPRRTPTVEAALRDITASDAKARAIAAEALGRAAGDDLPQAVAALTRALDDPTGAVRYAALLALGELGPAAESAVPRVIACLDDGEPPCREAAAIALGQLGGQAAEAALVEALARPEPELRFQSIASLAELAPARAVPLAEKLLEDADGKVRAQAAAALGDCLQAPLDGVEAARVRDLLAARLDDGDEIRLEAALALVRDGDGRGLLPAAAIIERGGDDALDVAATLGEVARVRPELASALAGDAALRDRLAARMQRFFGDPLEKIYLAVALARAGDPRGQARLEKAARSGRAEVRDLARAVLDQAP